MSTEAAALEQFLRAAPRSVLMLDYDGTLAPFHVDRFAATPYPGVEERLVLLSTIPQIRLVLVSGRSAQERRTVARANSKENHASGGQHWDQGPHATGPEVQAARGAGALRDHSGKFCDLDGEKGRTKQECESCENRNWPG